MFNQILCIIFMTIPGVFQALAMEQMLTAREMKVKSWQRILIWSILFGLGVGVKGFVNDYSVSKDLTGIYGILSFLPYLHIFYKDSLLKKFFAMVLMILGVSFSEIVILPMVKSAGITSMIDWDYTEFKIMLITGIAAILSVVGIWIVMMLWRKIFWKAKMTGSIWMFSIYAIYQTMAFFFIPELLVENNINYFVYISILLSLCCTVALLFIANSQSEKENLQNELSEEYQRKNLKKIHYQEIEKRRNELDSIMQENERFLERTANALECGFIKEAEEELMRRLQRLEKTREYPYCGIPLVNLVLTEKKKECEDKKIDLQVDVFLQENLLVNAVDLCRVLSNLMDNAIRACRYLEENSELEPQILLKVGVVREYLVIRCENTYNKNLGTFPEGTGHGLKILKDITDKYHGYLQKDEREDKFVVQVTLKMEK